MPRFDTNRMDLKERLVMLNRCAKVVKGGRRFSYSAVMVVGDGQGHVGIGMGKARETPEAIRKGIEQAKKNLFEVPLAGTTIPHTVREGFGAADVLLKPAAPGTGVIAGGAVRAVVEAAGVRDPGARTTPGHPPRAATARRLGWRARSGCARCPQGRRRWELAGRRRWRIDSARSGASGAPACTRSV